jgi:hypothetical protein
VARVSQAQKLEQQHEQQALAFFEGTRSALPDPRRPQGVRYPLRTVVVTALMAMVCGSDDAAAMQLWGEAHAAWLADFLDLPHGAPTQDVHLAVFGALDPEAFSAVFRASAALLQLRLNAAGRHIAVDGKTSRRSFDGAPGQPAIHTVRYRGTGALAPGGDGAGRRELLRVRDRRRRDPVVEARGCQASAERASPPRSATRCQRAGPCTRADWRLTQNSIAPKAPESQDGARVGYLLLL